MRPKRKNATPISLRIDTNVLLKLEEFCDHSGQTKTLAIERALTAYINDYYRRQAIADAADAQASKAIGK